MALLDDEDSRYPGEDENGNFVDATPALCRGCGRMLSPGNRRIADGCPCNTVGGINHGLVPKNTCVCDICDPAKTGSVRYPVELHRTYEFYDAPVELPGFTEQEVENLLAFVVAKTRKQLLHKDMKKPNLINDDTWKLTVTFNAELFEKAIKGELP